MVPVQPEGTEFSHIHVLCALPPDFRMVGASLGADPVVEEHTARHVVQADIRFTAVFSILRRSVPFHLDIDLQMGGVKINGVLQRLPVLHPEPQVAMIQRVIAGEHALVIHEVAGMGEEHHMKVTGGQITHLCTLARIPKADHRIIARRQVNGNAMPRPQGFRVNLQRAHKTFPAVKDVHVDT